MCQREKRFSNVTGGASVFQQGTFSSDSDSRWMGGIAMDNVGNIALGYGVSSSATFPSSRQHAPRAERSTRNDGRGSDNQAAEARKQPTSATGTPNSMARSTRGAADPLVQAARW